MVLYKEPTIHAHMLILFMAEPFQNKTRKTVSIFSLNNLKSVRTSNTVKSFDDASFMANHDYITWYQLICINVDCFD